MITQVFQTPFKFVPPFLEPNVDDPGHSLAVLGIVATGDNFQVLDALWVDKQVS